MFEEIIKNYFIDPFNYNIFFNSFLANLFSVALITLILFLLSDYILKIPNVNGHWHLISTTKNAKLATYKNMELYYTVLLWQEGKRIYGSGEKFKEKTFGNVEKLYDPGKRTYIKITGYLTRKLLKKHEVVLHIFEEGEKRRSSAVHFVKLIKFKNNKMEGDFVSTISDSSGNVLWERKTNLFG